MRKHFTSLRSQMMLLTTGTVLAVVILATVFYSSAQRMSEKKAATFVHSMLVQLGDSLDRIGNEMSYLGNALHSNEVLQQYYHAPTAIQRMQYGKSFIDFTSSLLNHSTTVSHIVIVNNDQSILSPTERNIIALDTLDSKYHLFKSDNLSSGFYGPAFDTFTNRNFFAYVQPVYNTRQGARFRQKLGTCVIFARLDLLQSTLRSALPTPGAALMLIEQDEQIILCCDADGNTLSLLPESFCSDMADGLQHSLTLNKTTYLTDSLLLSSMGWRLVSLVPEDEIAADLMPLLWLGMLICVVFAICIGVWNLHIQRSIMAPVKQLTAFIENDLDDKLQNRIHISTSSEMELFCQEINTLLDKVSEMTAERLQDQTRLYELNLAKKRAELSALQSQINPHFLYNTLDCIRGYGYMLNSSEIVSITNALSSIMRYCIKGADIVALRKEMTIVNYYLDIIRIRFPNRFNYVFDVDPALEDLAIPRFILQPVVERAGIALGERDADDFLPHDGDGRLRAVRNGRWRGDSPGAAGGNSPEAVRQEYAERAERPGGEQSGAGEHPQPPAQSLRRELRAGHRLSPGGRNARHAAPADGAGADRNRTGRSHLMNLMNIEQNAENLRLLGLIVAQRGETLYQHNWDSPCRRLLFSASKSFTGAAVGFAVQEGLLRLDDRLIELFPNEAPENPSENLCRATIRDALTMCIGQSSGYLMGAQRVGMAEEDWAKAVLALPFDEAPGTHFVYSNVGPYLAGLAVQKRAGCDLVDYLMPRLFAPLGIQRTVWEVDPLGRTFGAAGLLLALPELHKLGLLYQQGGQWQGKQLLDPNWVRESGSKQVENEEDGYGYLFWRGKYDSYRADGLYGQYSVILPAQEAVITCTAESRNQKQLLETLLDAIVPQL